MLSKIIDRLDRPIAGRSEDAVAPYDSIFKLTLIIMDSFGIKMHPDTEKFIKETCGETGITKIRDYPRIYQAAEKEFYGWKFPTMGIHREFESKLLTILEA